MKYEDKLPTVRVKKKDCAGQETFRSDSSLMSQMSTATIAAVRSALRGMREDDGAALTQAARNGHIVEELFLQENDLSQADSPEKSLLQLAKKMSEAAELAAEANKTGNGEMKAIMEKLPPYIETVLDDLAPSPARCYLPSSGPTVSRKKLPSIKDEVVNAMARTSDPQTIRSGISMFRLIENLEEAIPLAIKVGASLSEAKRKV